MIAFLAASQRVGVPGRLSVRGGGTGGARKTFDLDMPELFSESQVNREPRWPLLIKLIGGSLALHAAVLASMIYVPGVRDAFNIASLMAGTSYVDKAYSKTEIGDEVKILEMPAPKFHYPPGYFATPTELQLALAIQGSPAPQVIFTPRKPIIVPTPTPFPSPEVLPSPAPSAVASPAATPNASPVAAAKAGDPKTPEQAEKDLDKVAAANGVLRPNENEINTRPLKDWLARANAMRDKGELDLTSAIEITIEANLSVDCRLADAKVVQKTGDARLTDVAKEMVSAVGDSGMLSFLRDPKKVTDPNKLRCEEMPLRLTIKLDLNEISAQVETQADSAERAVEMAKGYNGLLLLGQFAKRGKDEELLYRNTKVTADGKQILVNFVMPRQTASEMLKKQLAPAT
ncbi:MAG: hypothetical protein ABJB97_07360 [Acidobacteriota bacterium]